MGCNRYLRFLLVGVASMVMMAGTAGTAWADTSASVSISLTAGLTPGICSVTASEMTGSFTSERWVTDSGFHFWTPVSGSGSITLTFDSTGAPGDRDCYANGTNDDFMNGDDRFLISTAFSLSRQGAYVYQRTDGEPVRPLMLPTQNLPEGGSSFDVDVNIFGVPNPDVPAGIYTSTLTITVSSTSP